MRACFYFITSIHTIYFPPILVEELKSHRKFIEYEKKNATDNTPTSTYPFLPRSILVAPYMQHSVIEKLGEVFEKCDRQCDSGLKYC